jgi:hypothetical protein
MDESGKIKEAKAEKSFCTAQDARLLVQAEVESATTLWKTRNWASTTQTSCPQQWDQNLR